MKNLPCPFCGDEDEPDLQGSHREIYASCDDCGATSSRGDNTKEALENWNRREYLSETQEFIRGFNEARKQIINIIKNLPEKKND